jgi:hypothetical protein
MMERRGIIPAVEFVVTRKDETTGYRALLEMGMEKMASDAVVLRHPEVFSAEAVEVSRARLQQWARR